MLTVRILSHKRMKHNFTLLPCNPQNDGTCRTIKAQYARMSVANYFRANSFGATCVIKIYESD